MPRLALDFMPDFPTMRLPDAYLWFLASAAACPGAGRFENVNTKDGMTDSATLASSAEFEIRFFFGFLHDGRRELFQDFVLAFFNQRGKFGGPIFRDSTWGMVPGKPTVATGVSIFMSPVFATLPATNVNVPLVRLKKVELDFPFGS